MTGEKATLAVVAALAGLATMKGRGSLSQHGTRMSAARREIKADRIFKIAETIHGAIENLRHAGRTVMGGTRDTSPVLKVLDLSEEILGDISGRIRAGEDVPDSEIKRQLEFAIRNLEWARETAKENVEYLDKYKDREIASFLAGISVARRQSQEMIRSSS
jgi:hypothetical protein